MGWKKYSKKEKLGVIIAVVGALLLLGLFFWLTKPFSEIDKMTGIYRYKVY